MKTAQFAFLGLLILSQVTLGQNKRKSVNNEPTIEHGRYLIQVTGCNDCHTPMYGPKNGAVPEKEWLSGSDMGWKGPWGTSYATNLRTRVANMTEDQWVQYLKNLKALPPMPFYSVNVMSEQDSRSMYRFIRSLGNHSQVIPTALPPGEIPKTPYVNFDVIPPQAKK
ncbi:cytochrome C [Bdellovibrio bacteriovorus]|uniref:cytochrome C n=1 Tax=Bdellovibrio TaxID=958 RepID=UPI0035A8EB32